MKILAKAAAVSCAALILLAPGTGCWTALAGDFAAPDEALPSAGVMAVPGMNEMPTGVALPFETLGADAQISNLGALSPAQTMKLEAAPSALPRAAATNAANASAEKTQQTLWNRLPSNEKLKLRDHAAALAESEIQAKSQAQKRRTILGRLLKAATSVLMGKNRAQSAAAAKLAGERTFDGLSQASAGTISANAPEISAAQNASAGLSASGLLPAKQNRDAKLGAAAVPLIAKSGAAKALTSLAAISIGVGFMHVGVISGMVVAGALLGGYIGRSKARASRNGGGGGYWDFGTPLYSFVGAMIGAAVGGIAGAVLISLHGLSLAALGGSVLHAALPGVGGAVVGAIGGAYLGVLKAKADHADSGDYNFGNAIYGLIGSLIGAAVLGTAAAALGAHFLAAHAAAAPAASAAPQTLGASASSFPGLPPSWTTPPASAYAPNQGFSLMQALKQMLPALKVYAIGVAAVAGVALSFYGALLLSELRALKNGKARKS